MHAYINQLAEHDVVSCLHFFVLLLLLLFFYRFSSCRSFAPSYISLSPFSIYSFVLELCSLRRGSRKIHHTWRTQKEWELLYLKQHHVTYSVLCNVYITFMCLLICGAQHFFSLSSSSYSHFSLPLPNPSQTNLFPLTPLARSTSPPPPPLSM